MERENHHPEASPAMLVPLPTPHHRCRSVSVATIAQFSAGLFTLVRMRHKRTPRPTLDLDPRDVVAVSAILLELGPSVFLAPLGWWIWWKTRPAARPFPTGARLGLLLATGMAFCLLIQHGDPAHANLVHRKTVRVLQVPLLLVSSVVFLVLVTQGVRYHQRRFAAVALLLALSLPTLFIDLAALSGFYDSGQTSAVSAADVKACEWLRTNTSRNSIV